MNRSKARRLPLCSLLALMMSVSMCSTVMAATATSSAEADLKALRNTTRQLIDALASKGAISQEDAVILRQTVLRAADHPKAVVSPGDSNTAPVVQEDAATENPATAEASETPAEPKGTPQAAVVSQGPADVSDPVVATDAAVPATTVPVDMPKVIRVPYVPDFVREEIRQQLRKDLHDDVVADVMEQARIEGWGMPDALPAWTRRLSFYGDMRLRWQKDRFASGNVRNSYFDFQKINSQGGLNKAGEAAFLNTTRDRTRLRLRLRLGLNARISDRIQGHVRLSSGSTQNPVSTNQTLGNTANRYQLLIDQAFMNYDWQSQGQGWWRPRVSLWGGRLPNPWVSTDLVWDSDVNFEGLTARVKLGHWGSETDSYSNGVYLTIGGFPLQESQRFSDKWLYAGQLGTSWRTRQNLGVDFSLAYYDYRKVRGEPNQLGSIRNDWTAPQYIQKGNSVIRISNDVGETAADPRLVGLAADFKVVDVLLRFDFGRIAPVVMTANYATNRGFSHDDILKRTGQDIKRRNDAYSLELQVGHHKMRRRWDWQTKINWRHVERDAVLDAFTDSDFHLGGTDAEGWWLSGSLGIDRDTWLTARWISADEIDGPPLGIDVIQFDLNTRF